MRIGLFYQIQVPKPWSPTSESQRIYEALEQIPYAEQQGFEVATALTHEEYKAAYDSFRPSAILLDLMMPHVDGLAILEKLGEKRSTAQLVIMTGYHPELLNSSRRLGSNYALDVRGTLRKPFGATELMYALQWLN